MYGLSTKKMAVGGGLTVPWLGIPLKDGLTKSLISFHPIMAGTVK